MESSSVPSQDIFCSPAVRLRRRNHGRETPIVKFLKETSKIKDLPKGLCLATANGGSRVGMLHQGDGVIIVDHGSRRNESNLMLNEFVAMFRQKTGYPIVEPAHMELAEPSIKDAFGLCVQQGACRILVSPFFLSPGRHWNQDIPSLTAEAAKEHPGVSYIITAPLGLHELLVDVVNDRIKHCLRHVAGKQMNAQCVLEQANVGCMNNIVEATGTCSSGLWFLAQILRN